MKTMPAIKKISVFTYTDFRLFLRDRYTSLKALDRSLTYQKLGTAIGFSSPGFFSQILAGTTRLPFAKVGPLAAALRLSQKEARYFALLVDYAQADNHEKKHELLKKVINGSSGAMRTLSAENYRLFDKWYYTAVHEILHFHRFQGDYKALAKMLNPPIAPSQAREAIALLEELRLITENSDGSWSRADADHLTTGFHAESVVINNYLLEMMALARKSVETVPARHRSLSTLTVSVSKNGFSRMERELHGFRRRLMQIAVEDTAEDRLYQVNLQLFPLTKIGPGEEPDGSEPYGQEPEKEGKQGEEA